ncbi:MAG: TlpA family protein disulfide reductase [Ilumatobacteraceae bacterium]
MTVNKRLLFSSLALAAAAVVTVAVIAANRNDSSGASDNVNLTPGKSLSPTIGTNAAVTGRTFPKVNLQTLNGDAYATADLVGHPLIVNFWYSGCLPCKKELPAFAAVQAQFGDRVRFVGVDTLPPSQGEENFARSRGVKYELLYDADGELTTAVGVANFPQTLFVKADGTIVAQTGELTAAKLEELIRTKLL